MSRRWIAWALVCGVLIVGCRPVDRERAPEPVPTAEYRRVSWSQLPGWENDAAHEAWPALLETCRARGSRAEWQAVCAAANAATVVTASDARGFFERHFDPYAVTRVVGRTRETSGLVTGYYEPLLFGSRTPSERFSTPLYAPPPDLLTIDLASVYPQLKGMRLRGRLQGNRVVPYHSRAELYGSSELKGYEIVWVDSPFDAFLLQVQGSGRVQLPDGETIRLQYADQNGHPYRSVGRYLVEIGELTVEEATLPGIRRWLAANPHRVEEVLNSNPSVVFFREEKLEDPMQGPKGALGVPLTPGRSIAVDPEFVPLGAPVFLATTHPLTGQPLERLVLAQDTGGAIRGPLRADFFWGFGLEAAEQAGVMRHQGRMWVLWPKGVATPWD